MKPGSTLLAIGAVALAGLSQSAVADTPQTPPPGSSNAVPSAGAKPTGSAETTHAHPTDSRHASIELQVGRHNPAGNVAFGTSLAPSRYLSFEGSIGLNLSGGQVAGMVRGRFARKGLGLSVAGGMSVGNDNDDGGFLDTGSCSTNELPDPLTYVTFGWSTPISF